MHTFHHRLARISAPGGFSKCHSWVEGQSLAQPADDGHEQHENRSIGRPTALQSTSAASDDVMAVARDPPQDQEHDRDANFWRLGPITPALDAQRGSTLRQVGRFPPPVSGCLFLISVFDTRRPVRELAETGFVDGAPAASRKLAASPAAMVRLRDRMRCLA